jgi:cell division protein FtsB
MAFNYIVLLAALSLSTTAAYYAIFGLVYIFSAATIPIIVMGSILEGSKVITAAWLHRNWSRSPRVLRFYLVCAVAVIMFITSMGIFGFLSRAHIEQQVTQGDNTIEIQELDRRIESQERRSDDAKTIIDQLDSNVETLIEYDRIRGDEGALAVREEQSEERDDLNEIIENANQKIIELRDQRSDLEREQLKLEAEVGPIKYVAELVYGESNERVIEKAVRAVIIVIVFVFDPLAIMLLIAANWSIMNQPKKRKRRKNPFRSKSSTVSVDKKSIFRMDNKGDHE